MKLHQEVSDKKPVFVAYCASVCGSEFVTKHVTSCKHSLSLWFLPLIRDSQQVSNEHLHIISRYKWLVYVSYFEQTSFEEDFAREKILIKSHVRSRNSSHFKTEEKHSNSDSFTQIKFERRPQRNRFSVTSKLVKKRDASWMWNSSKNL